MLDIIRHMELFDSTTFNTPIHVIGVGATGSWLALILAKLGIKGELINLYDFDHVEEHNVPNQAFGIHDIGNSKVKAIQSNILSQTGTKVKINEKFENQRLAGIVFLMVDSMAERKRIWENSIKLKPAVELLVEPRMGLDMGRIYNVNPMDMEQIRQYENTYYGDDTAEVSACGASMTVITSAMAIASWCARQLINHNSKDIELNNEILIDFKFNNIFTHNW